MASVDWLGRHTGAWQVGRESVAFPLTSELKQKVN